MEQRLIDANKLEASMYHEAFETDTDMQKWDSGCWIRYKMFENQIEKMPTVDAIEVVRCKDCKYLNIINKAPLYAYCGKSNYIFHLFEEDTREHFCSWGEKELEAM